jgi:L-aminopeptidase/D-esterase-like protein
MKFARRSFVNVLIFFALLSFSACPALQRRRYPKGLLPSTAQSRSPYLSERPTGCTVVLTEAGAVAGVDVRGSSPGTRETDLLDLVNKIEHTCNRSPAAALWSRYTQAMRYLEEKGAGLIRVAKVPIVPAAIYLI